MLKARCQQLIGLIKLSGSMERKGAQLGTPEKPVLMSSKKNKGRVGKGSRSRPLTISKEEFDNNWDRIFNK